MAKETSAPNSSKNSQSIKKKGDANKEDELVSVHLFWSEMYLYYV